MIPGLPSHRAVAWILRLRLGLGKGLIKVTQLLRDK